MKKLLLGISFLFLFSIHSLFAETYMGATANYNFQYYSLKDSFGSSYQYNARYPNFGFLIGSAEKLYNNYNLGAEIFFLDGSGTTQTKTIDNGYATAKFTTTWSFGGDIVPGYYLAQNTLAYLRLGIINTRMALRGSVTPAGLAAGYTNQGAIPRTLVGGRAGLGLEWRFYQKWKVRGEYVFTKYRPLSMADVTGFRDNVAPTNNQLVLGLVYAFN